MRFAVFVFADEVGSISLRIYPGACRTTSGHYGQGLSMLVLSRSVGQVIQIGGNIVIRVLRSAPGCVRIGIDAPREVKILRGELTNQWQEEPNAGQDDQTRTGDSRKDAQRGDGANQIAPLRHRESNAGD